jgi:hypothetical protein
METALRAAFVSATALVVVAVILLGRQLLRRPASTEAGEFPSTLAVQAGVVFCGAMFVVATAAGRLQAHVGDADTLLYAAVFGLATATVAHLLEGARNRSGSMRRAGHAGVGGWVLALPVSAGVLAGLVGTP